MLCCCWCIYFCWCGSCIIGFGLRWVGFFWWWCFWSIGCWMCVWWNLCLCWWIGLLYMGIVFLRMWWSWELELGLLGLFECGCWMWCMGFFWWCGDLIGLLFGRGLSFFVWIYLWVGIWLCLGWVGLVFFLWWKLFCFDV